MRRLEDGVAVADVRARRDAQAADLRRRRVGDVVAVQVRRGQNTIVLRADDDLLEDGVGDAIVDQHLLLPLAAPVGRPDRVEHTFDLGIQLRPKGLRAELQTGLDQRRVLLDGQVGIRVLVA